MNLEIKNKIKSTNILEFSVRCCVFGPFQSSTRVGCLGLLRDLLEEEKKKKRGEKKVEIKLEKKEEIEKEEMMWR